MSKLISIIVPVYNVESYLERCLESIMNQSYSALQVILIDDGSTDNSGKICDSYKEKDNRFVVIHKENGGVSSARNVGMDLSVGYYIMFIDADDYIDVDYCHSLLDIALEYKADVACCSLIGSNGETSFPIDELSCDTSEIKEVSLKKYDFEFSKWYSINGPVCKLIKASLVNGFEKLRFDPTLCVGEDLVFYVQLMKKSQSCVAMAKPMYHYYLREGSAMHIKDFEHIYSEIKAWEYVCDMLEEDGILKEKSSEKLLYYTYWFSYEISLKMLKNKNISKKIKKIFWGCRKQKKILGTGWKMKMLYPLLFIEPAIYFKIIR